MCAAGNQVAAKGCNRLKGNSEGKMEELLDSVESGLRTLGKTMEKTSIGQKRELVEEAKAHPGM